MAMNRALTKADFDALLAWLDPDRERAASRYEEIRARLIRIFVCRGSPVAEELADQTINRVTAKLPEVLGSYSGDPALYFYGVGRYIYLESLKSTRPPPDPPFQPGRDSGEENTLAVECLESCMEQLPPETRRLIVDYHTDSGQAKMAGRRRLALELGIDMNALRIRVHRIRRHLRNCVNRCTERNAPREK